LRDSFPVFKGFMLIKIGACRRCHTIGDKGNRLATNLNESIREKSIKTLIEAIKKPFYYMPQFNFSDDQIDWILNGLLDYAFYAKKINDGFVTVHFSTTKESKNIFSEKCGKCHKIILKQVGPLGDGERGPNLSGLYMEEFNSIKEVHRWDKKALKKWLKNPRVIKKGALMPVILKNDREIEEILEFFNG
jgi:cytochrome c2